MTASVPQPESESAIESPPIRAALTDILAAAGEELAVDGLTITGSDPILPSRFRIGTAGAAAIGAVGLAVDAIWAARSGRRQRLALDAAAIRAAYRSERHIHPVGGEPFRIWDPVSGFYRTADDRFVQLHLNQPRLKAGAIALLGVPEDRAAVARAVAAVSGQALEDAFAAAGLTAGLVRTPAEWRAHGQGRAVANAPLIEIVKLGDGPRKPLAAADRPLAGIRVLDLTHLIAGPLCSRTLAEHGATVLRLSAPHLFNHDGMAADMGHGKLAAHLDLRDPAGRARLLALARDADIVVQGFRPGAMARFGITPEAMAALNPSLVFTTLSAYGPSGPWRERPGFDSLVQSVSGIAYDGGRDFGLAEPRHLPAQAIDFTAGYLGAFATLVALIRRAREGGSYLVRYSLARTGAWFQSLGRVADPAALAMAEPATAELAPYMTESATGYGRLRHVTPVLRMSQTPPRWTRPTAPFGADPPAWPAER
jgi:crotonobetainyl-CoA:carnitine CoA-transferase CaiB-like acyl-CoA transferase